MIERSAIEVTGLVQGVGFRPFVYSLATALGLRGSVNNRGARVFIDVEGEPGALGAFIDRLTTDAPPYAFIDRIHRQRLAPAHHHRFAIAGSEAVPEPGARVPADVATCDQCLRELFDPANRRYRHAFITCSTCGPRFSIIRSMPYDRAGTTMGEFEPCVACRAEYADPADRRFHAQSIACPQCGPALVARDGALAREGGDAALRLAVATLLAGGIVAIKGLGGFHLACDATSQAAVAGLRRRKGRDAKPLAVMVSERDGRRIGTRAGAEALAALVSPARPIVLVDKIALEALPARLAPNVAGGCPAVGLLLPYTPVHHLLLHDVARPLVMTSGNRSDEPMVCDDQAALAQLGDIAGLFLTHDRRIEARCDDSVVRTHAGRSYPVRRSRGQAPAPVMLAEDARPAVLAVGGHLKNTFCLAAGRQACLSPHVGSLETAASYQAFSDAVGHMAALLNIVPEVIAHDLHPDYLSTRYAMAHPGTLRVAVQHHHAHVLSCVAEHRYTEPVIGVAFDGAGLGADGAIWGGEFLIVEGVGCTRVAHLSYVPLPGGDAAAREPWRMAVAHLAAAYGPGLGPLADALADRVTASRLDVVRQMLARGVCSPPTSSMGRLFDAVAALVGLRDVAGFEGQAAMELEAVAASSTPLHYEFDCHTASPAWTIDAAPVVRGVAADLVSGGRVDEISAAFHQAVGVMIAEVAARISHDTGIRRVVLTGGVFQNALLSRHAARALAGARLDVLEHHSVPCNDGGLALGQALLAARMARATTPAQDQVACA